MKQKSLVNKRNVLLAGLVLLAVLLFLGVRWISFERQPLPEAQAALESDLSVTVTLEPWLTFSPNAIPVETGLIFYPGGRISYLGYSDLLRAIAGQGYLVVVPRMPFNIAAAKPNAADEIIAAHPEIKTWVIGGHSVGGTMAAQYTATHNEQIAGLVIWASYPANNADISALDIPAAVIYGSLDPAANDSQVLARRSLFADDAVFVRIEGGDHHQFGSYEIPPEDRHATISRAEQHSQILEATLALLQRASGSR